MYQTTYDPRGYLPLDARWLACISEGNPEEAQAICDTYDSGCQVIGYDANAAIAQGCVETAWFTSDRWRNSHNAAGIGIYSDSTADVIWGPMPHGDVETGVHGQLDLLTDYYTDGSEPFGTLSPLGFGGMVLGYSQLQDMDGVWAADEGYSEAITGVMNEVIPETDEGGTGVVTALDVMKMAISQFGHPRSGTYDTLNGDHAWSYWCESYIESTHRNLGLSVTPQPSAIVASQHYDLQPGRAPFGAAMWFGTSFYYPDGHTAFGTGGPYCLGTLTDGTGVGLMEWNETTEGYLGWAYYQGVEPYTPNPSPPIPNWLVQEGNPYSPDADGQEVGIGGGFLRFYNSVENGLDPMVVLGYAKAREQQATVTDPDGTVNTRTVQSFERGWLVYQPENGYPYDIVMAQETSQISPAGS